MIRKQLCFTPTVSNGQHPHILIIIFKHHRFLDIFEWVTLRKRFPSIPSLESVGILSLYFDLALGKGHGDLPVDEFVGSRREGPGSPLLRLLLVCLHLGEVEVGVEKAEDDHHTADTTRHDKQRGGRT